MRKSVTFLSFLALFAACASSCQPEKIKEQPPEEVRLFADVPLPEGFTFIEKDPAPKAVHSPKRFGRYGHVLHTKTLDAYDWAKCAAFYRERLPANGWELVKEEPYKDEQWSSRWRNKAGDVLVVTYTVDVVVLNDESMTENKIVIEINTP